MLDFKSKIRYFLLAIIFIVLCSPFLISLFFSQNLFQLKGVVNEPVNITFDKHEWITAEYQQKKEEYLNSTFGLRNWCVRFNNQIAYSFFNKAKANGVIVGKENYLYEASYIESYSGKNYVGEDSIRNTVNKLKFISDTLSKLGKQLIIVFAPGKASFYPEYIPDAYLPFKKQTNYSTFSEVSNTMKLNVIDFNKWFIENKTKSKYPLYPKYGIHWSIYGTVLAADSLVKNISNLRNITLPKIKITEINMGKPVDSDYDIADGMNLLFENSSFDMAYPKITLDTTNVKTKPKVLVISDSFYWGLYNLGISNCFQNDHFWYYNKQVFPESGTKELLTDHLNIGDEINKHDVIVIISTEATLNKIGWGFIERTELFFREKNAKDEHERMKNVRNFIEKYIKPNKTWMDAVNNRAKEKKITLDSMLLIEAIWQIEHPNS